ncbi:MAG: dermonecrotic toxin domain-containing protein [Pseudomonas sp.]|uniref:dermonecrotic toxin domain-containing protein n=1 Tax=Pseudomonas sp. TaxID=306 RepID=UPI003D6E5ADB
MNEHPNVAPASPPSHPRMGEQLQSALANALPQTPEQFAEQQIKEKWGQDIDPQNTLLVTLDYNYRGHPPEAGVQQGQIASSQTLLHALLSNEQTVGDGRFAETAFGLYSPPDVGPAVRIVANVDEFADHGNGNHDSYEGIYRRTQPQTYGPMTQIALRPADFKKWVWELDLKTRFQAYLDRTWPSDDRILAREPYPLRTSAKAALVMAACLQRQEGSLSHKGLALAMQAAGLPADTTWDTLSVAQLQAPTRVVSTIEVSRLKLYRYTSTDIWCFRERSTGAFLMYVPGNSSPLHEFSDIRQLRAWIVKQGSASDTKHALVAHFAEDDREDGTFHAGVLTALEGMAVYPRQHRLGKNAGLFNDDGFWDPRQYIDFAPSPATVDPYARLVLTMKQAAMASVTSIRDDAQVNRDDLSAFVEPLVKWINQFGPLALFVPGGEGLLVLAGIIDAGYGVAQAVNAKSRDERAEGISRTVFGLLNALPLAEAVAELKVAGASAERPHETTSVERLPERKPAPAPSVQLTAKPQSKFTRLELLRGVSAPQASFSDDVLAHLGRVITVDDDLLRLMHAGRPPTPLLADSISRFKLDQELDSATDPGTRADLFNRRYQALQHSEHEWVRVFQREYPGLPKNVVEQFLDRSGVDIHQSPEAAEVIEVLKRLDSKARQYQQHLRLNRAYEGLYLRSIAHADSDVLALHSLDRLPGWPKGVRVEVLDGSISGRVLDRSGPLDAPDSRRLIKTGECYGVASTVELASGGTDLFAAILSVLSTQERSALALHGLDQSGDLRRLVSEAAFPRSELMLGLGRMDAGLPFDRQGLRGGGFPTTPQGGALTHQMMRLQLKQLYPQFTDSEADALLLAAGVDVQAYLDRLAKQFEQLRLDLTGWIDQTVHDLDDMDIDFLAVGDEEAAGLNAAQLAAHNLALAQHVLEYEREIRSRLADELLAIWQKRAPAANRLYSGETFIGYKVNLDFEEYHQLPNMSIRFNEVIELSMRDLHLMERESLDAFLESFPNLRTLNLERYDLRRGDLDGDLVVVLPPVIPQLKQLTTLNLKDTFLTFQENTAAQLGELVNLQSLNLSDNPLNVAPVLLGMKKLRQIDLRNTGITTCPIGIKDEPYLTSLDLRDNRISRVPQAILNQAIARDRVRLWGNPLTDEDTLLRIVKHREQTGINLWLAEPGANYGSVTDWLREGDEGLRQARALIWQRLEARPSGAGFLRVVDGLSLTADFRVNYPDLQARVWRLLHEADASDELWGWLKPVLENTAGDAENPFVVFTALETKARLYADWVALGRGVPIGD